MHLELYAVAGGSMTLATAFVGMTSDRARSNRELAADV